MLVVYSINKVPIRLTDERWQHIIRRHPEVEDQAEKVLETLEMPDYILEGDYDEILAVKFYKQTPLTQKYLIVVYKEILAVDGFVVTAYFTREFSKKRRILWKP